MARTLRSEGPGTFFRHAVFGALLVAASCGPARGDLVINEFLPDPVGSDSGREFVELMNPGLDPVPLAEISLQFGNGAEGAVWATRWDGDPGTVLEPGGLYLIVDRNWLGDIPGQAEAYLGLQNGPDALRLVRDGAVLDLVGYGPLTDEDMMENAPASVAVGRSVARRPDGVDSGNNSLDFVPADPTPGARNFHPFALTVTDWELEPPSVDRAGTPIRFSAVLLNEGTETFPVGQILLRMGNLIFPALLDQTPPAAARGLTWRLTPEAEGLWPLEILIPLPVAGDTLMTSPASLQVGPGELVLNEVLAAPGHGQGEWLEIAAVGQVGVSLENYRVRDEDGGWRQLPAHELEPGGLMVLAQDSLALADWHVVNLDHGAVMDCDVETALGALHNLSGWPSLNNTVPEGRDFADRLYLANPAGNVIDHVTLESEAGPGLSLERLAVRPRNPGAANWAVSTAGPGSTPGCPNSVSLSLPVPNGFVVAPRILDPARGTTTVHFLFTLTAGQQGWSLRVFDLWGHPVRDFGGDDLGPGGRDLPWGGTDETGRPAPSGGYVAVLQLKGLSGEIIARHRTLLAIR